MKLWLDDERNPMTYGLNFTVSARTRALDVLYQYGRDGWIWVETVEQAKQIILREHISVLSCDNDLGDNIPEGHTLLNWLEEQAFLDPHFDIPDNIHFHSANDARRESAEQAIVNINKFRGKSGNLGRLRENYGLD